MIMTLVSLRAMAYIHKYTEPFEQVGIKRNNKLFLFYIGFWISCSMMALTIIGISADMTVLQINQNNFEKQTLLAVVMAIVILFQLINMVLLDFVILAHYWRAGKKKEVDVATSLTMAFSKERNKRENLVEDDDAERMRAVNRMHHYKEMADA